MDTTGFYFQEVRSPSRLAYHRSLAESSGLVSMLRRLVPQSASGRQAVAKVLNNCQPLIRLTASAYRRTVVRKTRFAVVVGSYGKTTTARALSLALTGSIHPHLQNNAKAWTSIAALRTRPGAKYAVVEVGISRPGQMKKPAATLAPDIVVVTSIGS